MIAATLLYAARRMATGKLGISIQPHSTTKDGRAVHIYTLTNKNRMQVCISDYGATIVSLAVPDRVGKFEDVVSRM